MFFLHHHFDNFVWLSMSITTFHLIIMTFEVKDIICWLQMLKLHTLMCTNAIDSAPVSKWCISLRLHKHPLLRLPYIPTDERNKNTARFCVTFECSMRLDTFTLTRYTSDKQTPVRWNADFLLSFSQVAITSHQFERLTLCCEDARSVRRMLSLWQQTSLHAGAALGLDVWAKATRGKISMRLSMSLTPNQRDLQQPQTLCW